MFTAIKISSILGLAVCLVAIISLVSDPGTRSVQDIAFDRTVKYKSLAMNNSLSRTPDPFIVVYTVRY